jgi:DNA replication and repair protein RecF
LNYKLYKLQVSNFRNLLEAPLEFSLGINCIFGQNGNGKTNLLEAIYFLINNKTFRKNSAFPQFLSMDCEKAEIIFNSIFSNEEEQFTFTGKVLNKKQDWYLNNKPSKRKFGTTALFINPFDSFQFHSIPAFRRAWVDTHIGLINKDYKKVLKKYQSVLKQRNILLSKKPAHFKEQIIALNEQFCEYTLYLLEQRLIFLDEIKEFCLNTFQEIFSEQHVLELRIETKFNELTIDAISKYYTESLEKEIVVGNTMYGVHRDDYIFMFDGYNSFEYCSLGQQKMSFLSLIFAYIELFRYKYMSYPIVLIDDVSGELDGRRWRFLINFLKTKDFQVFITTANESFKEKLLKIENAKKFSLDVGEIKTI